jgi:hypothetical protein
LLIPCILHLENRVGEKMITIILRKAMDEFRGRKEDFQSTMNTTFKTKVLGTDSSPSQWKLPFAKDAEENLKLEHIQVRNNVARCIVREIDTIIEDAWASQNSEWQRELITAILKYRAVMQILLKHSEYTNEKNFKVSLMTSLDNGLKCLVMKESRTIYICLAVAT